MSLRRLTAALPPALVVALLAHLAAAGLGHAPGGHRAPALLEAACAAAGLAALWAFLGTALRGRAGASPERPDPFLLAVLGFFAYVGIELTEGHVALGGALRALAAVVPLALAVAIAWRLAGGLAGRAGTRFAVFARTRGRRAAHTFRYAGRHVAFVPARHACAGRRSGRAPPRFA